MRAPYQSRFKSLFDFTAWLLILPAAFALYQIDLPMLQTMAQWLLVALVIAGLTVIVTRVMFPQVSIAWLVRQVENGNTAAGILAAALVLFVGLVFLALLLWARA